MVSEYPTKHGYYSRGVMRQQYEHETPWRFFFSRDSSRMTPHSHIWTWPTCYNSWVIFVTTFNAPTKSIGKLNESIVNHLGGVFNGWLRWVILIILPSLLDVSSLCGYWSDVERIDGYVGVVVSSSSFLSQCTREAGVATLGLRLSCPTCLGSSSSWGAIPNLGQVDAT